MSGDKPPLPGRIVGYAVAVVVVAASARLVWELLSPLLPVLVALLAIVGICWFIVGKIGR
jgi:large-conductance mechanosensitive channel